MPDQQQDKRILQLTGEWKYVLDSQDNGVSAQWYKSFVTQSKDLVTLPGTLTVNGIGDTIEWSDELNRESVRSLRQRHSYVGPAWYEYETHVPAEWIGKRVVLFLERIMFQSTLWVNGQLVGQQDSLSVAHEYDVSNFIQPGKTNQFTLKIDNRDVQNLGSHSSAYTEETQTIWNGVIGRMELHALEPFWVNNVQIFPQPDLSSVVVKGTYHNTVESEAHANLRISAHIKYGAAPHASKEIEKSILVSGATSEDFEWEYELGENALLWDEFNPNIYELRIEAQVVLDEREPIRISEHRTFGLRCFQREGRNMQINNRPIFLRGTLECCIFPLTGHPPMDIDSWLKLFQAAKDYGLNHIRFHSWCPPEAAFEAADLMGLYLQVEAPMWMDTWNMAVGTHAEHYTYLPEEAWRIVQAYGNHPSFCIYSNGNELNGDFDLLHRMVDNLKALDDRRLYTLTTNWDRQLDPADDLFIAQSVDGIGVRGQYFPEELVLSTQLDFRDAVAQRPVPVISHEVGQYAVYPDVQEIEKYSGALRPVNLEVIHADLKKRDLLGDLRSFVHGSGMFALQLYRDEIEAALRTPNLGGFQLLDLHDFPGQSTATVGILNAFWESKGLIEAQRFREFCGPTVLLLGMPKRIYTNTELYVADINIAHFGVKELRRSSIQWKIADGQGRTLDQGSLLTDPIPFGSGQPLGRLVSDVPHRIQKSDRLTISLELEGSEVRNEWSFWVYKSIDNTQEIPAGMMVKRTLDEEMEQTLAGGENVLFLAKDADLKNTTPGKFYPFFWSPAHFATEAPCGIIIDSDHSALSDFPTREYAEYPWKDLLDGSVSIVVNDDIAFNPIVQVIPNFAHNRKLMNLAEYTIGKGKLMICGIDIEHDMNSRPVAAQLRKSLIDYMSSDSFVPKVSMEIQDLRRLLKKNDSAAVTGSDHSILEYELAGGKLASSDSVSEGRDAMNGNDGIDETYWQAQDDLPGHWWQVDLLQERSITGTKVRFHEQGNFRYVIQVSSDALEWRVVSNQTGQTLTEHTRTDRFEANGRYVRIVYNGLPKGVRAGHRAFEVYGR
ncbi:sugar-binding domain-containing protein [Paenibacillus xylanexedens]|uniref:sugar-binding domain-containing protein n=1 Tax=Paenibacillus xylanexedens TaxID=528191 RepID=UPI0011A6517B|nr:sugar-binding domain-containing protein [Paenibacillus xylanexedens]